MENNYNENNTNEYTYGEGYNASEEPAAGPDTYSYEEFPPTGNDVPPTDQGPQQTSYYQPEPAPKTGFAVASLVLGIISIVISCLGYNIITAILAIVFGALYLSKKQPQRRGMAIVGLILGIVSIAIFVILIILVVVFAVGMFASDPLYGEMYNEILNGMY